MAIEGYVKQILSSPAFVFDDIISKLLTNNMKSARIELSRHSTEVDTVLFQAIKSILVDLHQEEGLVSRLLYSTFGFEFRKNKRREQLIYLGIQLKTQYEKVKAESSRVGRQIERFSLCIADLNRLKEGFSNKNIYLQDAQTLNKGKFYINEVEIHLLELKEMQSLLQKKQYKILDREKSYRLLLQKIPRYHQLQEESHRLLLASSFYGLICLTFT